VKAFAELYAELDASTSTTHKVAALQRYLQEAGDADAAWAVYFLAGGKPRQVVPTAVLRELACQVAGIDDWLFEECYQAVGDLAETIAHVLPRAEQRDDAPLSTWIEDRLLPLRGLSPQEQAQRIAGWWQALDADGRFLLTKLIGGGFRVGVSKLLVQRAIAQAMGLDAAIVAQRMMGYTDARRTVNASAWQQLTDPAATPASDPGQPYPFFLAHALDAGVQDLPSELGPLHDWQVEWKYDGIRAQVVKRTGRVWIWSRGEELITERFPEVEATARSWPDGTVLDGEILVFDADGGPAPFARLQQRIGRKTLTKRILAEVPVGFMAYDLLEQGGEDGRAQPQAERRQALEQLAAQPEIAAAGLRLSPVVDASDWDACAALRATARERRVEGFMLKHRSSAYGIGRRKTASGEGEDARSLRGWLKWKIEAMTVDAVLVYAQAGHGRRASLYTDYTFAVWNRMPADDAEAQAALQAPAAKGDDTSLQLVPVAKAYSGLTDEEIRRVDQVIRRTTREKFGPVRSVQPTLMFELGFEGINASPRHKSGVALRFPRMLRIRDDKPLHEADCLPTLLQLIR
jgi:DNA ligase 1